MNEITIRDEERGLVSCFECARELAEAAANHREIKEADLVCMNFEDRARRFRAHQKPDPEAERRAKKMQAGIVGLRAMLLGVRPERVQ